MTQRDARPDDRLTISNGVATADFPKELQAYGGGSARVLLIREQITLTLKQFPECKRCVLLSRARLRECSNHNLRV